MKFLPVFYFALLFTYAECNLAKSFVKEKIRGIQGKLPRKIPLPGVDHEFEYMGMKVQVKAKNIFVTGFKKLRIDHLKFAPGNSKADVSIFLPQFSFAADYSVLIFRGSGKFRRSGNIRFKMANLRADLNLDVNLVPFDIDKLKFELKSGVPEFFISGLFEEEQSKLINKAINVGIRLVLDTSKIYISSIISFVLLPILKIIMKGI